MVNQAGFKVVLTGEGADEFLAGYDIFKEVKIRLFWAKQAESSSRPALLQRLYPYIPMLSNGNTSYLAAFFGQKLDAVHDWDYSHSLRWNSTARAKRFFSTDLQHHIATARQDAAPDIELPLGFSAWHPLARAQYLEIRTFLSQYLLSSQGDRMMMANSVEGRFPFLDYRLIEFCNQLPPTLKLKGLTEKYLLKQVAKDWLPEAITQRKKQAYRAPIHRIFAKNLPYEMLSPEALNAAGLFDAPLVQKLIQKAQRGFPLGESDDMALAGILSTQLLHSQFIQNFRTASALSDRDDIKVCTSVETI
jgi:asparagine synthase (glutamine-hydrolysing)